MIFRNMRIKFHANPSHIYLLLLLVGASVYLIGLRGGFVFDDYVNIVDNQTLRPEVFSWRALSSALISSDASPLKRPIASLSFLANYQFFGINPLSFKLVNLAIHLLNGCLVYALLKRLLPRLVPAHPNVSGLAGWCALFWVVHPLNLTAVLYIVQRMTSLSASFMLLSLLSYVRLRERQLAMPRSRVIADWVSLSGFALLGLLTKENAVLLPLFLLLIERTVFRSQAYFTFRWQYLIVVAPLVLLPWCLRSALNYLSIGFDSRPFSMAERFLTELRVLVFYTRQILLPDPTQMALLHADWPISKNLWTPWTTTAAALFWLFIVIVATLPRQRPIIKFGIGWFLLGHLLESTVLPLDLIYEHRNYLPSIGLLCLACVVLDTMFRRYPKYARLLRGGLLLILCTMTTYRAWQWSDPFTLALTEMQHNPTSARARYEIARHYYDIFLLEHNPKFLTLAREELRGGMHSTDDDLDPLAALINTYVVSDGSVPEDLMNAYEQELLTGPPTDRRLKSIEIILSCQINDKCPMKPEPVLRVVGAALSNPKIGPRLKGKVLEWLAIYFANVLKDLPAAKRVMEDAVIAQPVEWTYRLRLLEIEAAQGDINTVKRGLTEIAPVMTHWKRLTDPAVTSRYDSLRKIIE